MKPKKKNMSNISVTCFGAGAEVGRSSILVEISGKKVLLDCGVNFSNEPKDRLPRFPDENMNIDVVLVSHIHSDHLAAVPYLTEVKKCNAPVYMSKASHLMMPIMLKDYLKVTDRPPYSFEDLNSCLEKIRPIEFYSRIEAVKDVYIQAFPAGHIIGACMFYVSVKGRSFVYTGDYSSIADHHLNGCSIPKLYPDLLLTESTYGNRIRESIAIRKKSLVQLVHSVVSNGGKVLIPVFAVGRFHEICLMLEEFWARMGYTEPIYYHTYMGEKAITIYKKCIRWMNPTVQTAYFDENKSFFKFEYTKPYDRSRPIYGGCVMLATSGMLSYNSNAFKFFVTDGWHKDPKNLILFPGYCGPNTFGRAVLERPDSNSVHYVDSEKKAEVDIVVKCQVQSISFSAHADQFEIVSLCEQLCPHYVGTIHGDLDAVSTLTKKIMESTKSHSFVPQNCSTHSIKEKDMKKVYIEKDCIQFLYDEPSSFEGALVKANHFKIMKTKTVANLNGISIRELIINRRIHSKLTYKDIAQILASMGLLSPDKLSNPTDTIITPAFTVRFTESGVRIRYSMKDKQIANMFSSLIEKRSNTYV